MPIKFLSRRIGGPEHQRREYSVVQIERLEVVVSQHSLSASAVQRRVGQYAVDEGMAETEGGGREFVRNRRVRVGFVVRSVSVEDAELVAIELLFSEGDRQVFLIDNHLHFCTDDFSGR